jgi:menaquinone-dependent protoporphyrinogen oxidase
MEEPAMRRVLVVHASRHGGTAGIAEKIGAVLRADGVEVIVSPAATMPDPSGFDACVIGAGVYMGSWVKEGVEYLERYGPRLAGRPVWLFSSGPLPGSSKEATDAEAGDPYQGALGPADGPGSGGRRKIEALAALFGPREHHVFRGAYDPKDPPKAISERLVRLMPASKDILPPGDFRDWDAIAAWAHQIAIAIAEPVPVG